MKIKTEVNVFDDPEYCNNENDKKDRCRQLFRGQCELFIVNLKHIFPDIGYYDHYHKCDQCKKAYQEATA